MASCRSWAVFIGPYFFCSLLVLIPLILAIIDCIHQINHINSLYNYNDAITAATCQLDDCRSNTSICGYSVCYNYILRVFLTKNVWTDAVITSDSSSNNIWSANGSLLISNVTNCYYVNLDLQTQIETLSLNPISSLYVDTFRRGFDVISIIVLGIFFCLIIGYFIFDLYSLFKRRDQAANGPVPLDDSDIRHA